MKYSFLGKTSLKISELCFGVLPMGPLQTNVSLAQGAEVILAAMQNGVNFFDTAQMYQTYAYLRRAMDNYHRDVIISSKSTAADYPTMEKAIIEGLHEVRRDYFDIFLLHAARATMADLEQRAGAWQCLMDYKQKGHLRYIGVSTHIVDVVSGLSASPEVDVIFSLINMAGKGLIGGNADDMRRAVEQAARAGKGQFSMKLLGGGTLLSQYREALAFGRAISAYDAHAVGMTNLHELDMALRTFNGQPISDEEISQIKSGKAWVLMETLCKGCGLCVERCPSGALSMADGISRLQPEECVLCGYCADACPEFAIRVR